MKYLKLVIAVIAILLAIGLIFLKTRTGKLIIRSFSGDSMASSLLWEEFDEADSKLLSYYFLRKSADQGDANSNFVLFFKDQDNNAITENSLRRLKYAAEHGHASAMFELGTIYMQGRYIQKNEQEGRLLIVQSACSGYLVAKEPVIEWLIGKNSQLSMQLAYAWALKLSSETGKGSPIYRDAQGYQKQVQLWWVKHNLPVTTLNEHGKKCFESRCYCNIEIYKQLF